jgi:hypothetical protein
MQQLHADLFSLRRGPAKPPLSHTLHATLCTYAYATSCVSYDFFKLTADRQHAMREFSSQVVLYFDVQLNTT